MLIGLDGPRAIILWWTLPAYLMLVGAAVLASAGVLAWDTRATWRPARAVDSALLATALALAFGRLEHIALHWAYFAESAHEILNLSAGGLGSHGAIAGAALGGALASRWFRLDYGAWLGAAAFALPLVALAAWWGCAAAACSYGAEVANLAEHPSWLVWEARGDFLMVAPRYAVQPLGVWASAAALVVVAIGAALGVRGRRRAGLALALVMAVSFALGFMRGDAAAMAAGLRVSQWLDVAVAAAGVGLALWPRGLPVPAA